MKVVFLLLAAAAVLFAIHIVELYLTVWPHTLFNQWVVALWLVAAVNCLADAVKHRA